MSQGRCLPAYRSAVVALLSVTAATAAAVVVVAAAAATACVGLAGPLTVPRARRHGSALLCALRPALHGPVSSSAVAAAAVTAIWPVASAAARPKEVIAKGREGVKR